MHRKRNKPEVKKKRAWELDVDADEDSETATPSEAFLSLQKELDEKEKIQKENEQRVQEQETLAAKAAESLREKEELRRANAKNPRVFLDIEIADITGTVNRLRKGANVGCITIELFEDAVPRTAENFRALCTGEKPRGSSGFPLSYLGNIFHRIVPKFMAQGGDITREDGSGGESIYGPTFTDESFGMKHDQPGLLSMANSGRDTNNSQFFITFGPLPWLDSKHVVFGKIVDGMEVVRTIEGCGTTSGEPTKRVQIAECGQIRDEDKEKNVDEDRVEREEGEGEADGEHRRRGKRPRVRFAKNDNAWGEKKEAADEGPGKASATDEGRRNDRRGNGKNG